MTIQTTPPRRTCGTPVPRAERPVQETAPQDTVQSSGKVDFRSIDNAREAAMLPILDAGVQLALKAAQASVAGGASFATVGVHGYLAHHKVNVNYHVDAAGIRGGGLLGDVRIRESMANGASPLGNSGAIESTIGDSPVSGQAHAHNGVLHVDAQLGRVDLHMIACEGETPGTVRLEGLLDDSPFEESLTLAMEPDGSRGVMYAQGRVGERKLSREYDLYMLDDGVLIEGTGRLGRGSSTDLSIRLKVNS
jgi:hypothetical protein